MPKDFFAYGTLMVEEIMLAVTGDRYEFEPALLRDYRRAAIRNEFYPGIVPHGGERVAGTLYFDLTPRAWERLDLFEGEMYRRQIVEVAFADGRMGKGQTYVVRPEFEFRLSRRKWHLEEFLRSGKQQFEMHYRGFEWLKPEKDE